MTSPVSNLALDLFVLIAKRIRVPLEAALGLASTVPLTPFLDPTLLPWTRTLELHWREIRTELDAVLRDPGSIPSLQEISVRQSALTTDDRWKSYFFFGYGFRSERHCAECPVTARLLEGVPGMRTAFFSILAPGKTLPPHRGPYRGVLRYHLALLVPHPADACGIQVADDVRHWEAGKSLLFDDTYMHTAWNRAEHYRAVLFVDIERPLRRRVASLNRFVLALVTASPYVQQAKRRHDAWEQQAMRRNVDARE